VSRYAFDEVRAALRKHCGLSLHRGGDMTDLGSRRRRPASPRLHGNPRFRSLGAVVRSWPVIARAVDLVRELAGVRLRMPPQQESACGVVRAFFGVPCEFGADCAYPGLGWRCGHLRAR